MKDKQLRNLVRITLVVIFTTTAIPEVLAKPSVFLQLSYLARALVVMGWLWWLTGEKRP